MFTSIDVSIAQQTDIKRELKRLNAKIDRERVRTDSLETQISILLPDLRNTLRATVEAKKQTDSVAILLIKINSLIISFLFIKYLNKIPKFFIIITGQSILFYPKTQELVRSVLIAIEDKNPFPEL